MEKQFEYIYNKNTFGVRIADCVFLTPEEKEVEGVQITRWSKASKDNIPVFQGVSELCPSVDSIKNIEDLEEIDERIFWYTDECILASIKKL